MFGRAIIVTALRITFLFVSHFIQVRSYREYLDEDSDVLGDLDDLVDDWNEEVDADALPADGFPLQRRYIRDFQGPFDFYSEEEFKYRHTLRQHMLRHAGKQYKCGLPGCPTILRTETELNNHRKLVHEEPEVREFQCSDCLYAAKTKTQLIRHRRRLHNIEDPAGAAATARLYKCHYQHCQFQTKVGSHLKRHFLLHTGKKPYKCRHCDYASNNVENLRKHVLSTKKHVGKTIYQCESCPSSVAYQTNFSKELRAHLLEAHPDVYPTSNIASRYIAGIFEESADDAALCE